MEKIYGASKAQNGIVKVGNCWIIFYGCFQDEKGGSYEYRHTFRHEPTIEEVKQVITAQINEDTDNKIQTGFAWNGKPVYLSRENQMNFKAAYDIAFQTAGESLPVRFKLGEDEKGTPVYHDFKDLQEFSDFFIKAVAFINGCINAGWEAKDSVDYSVYKT